MRVHELPGGAAGRVAGIRVTVENARGEAAVEQQRQAAGEAVRIVRARRRRLLPHPHSDRALVLDRARMHVRARARLCRRVDERAAVVPVVPAGRDEGVEHADETVTRIGTRRFGGGEELPAPGLVDAVEVRKDEIVLAREVLVERGLGHPRLGDHGVDAGRPHAARVEEPEGGVEDPVPRRSRSCRHPSSSAARRD